MKIPKNVFESNKIIDYLTKRELYSQYKKS